jgi:hypothetical protein
MTAATSWELDGEHEEFLTSVRAFVDRHMRPVRPAAVPGA